MKTKLPVCWINHNDEPRRIRLELRKDLDGYRWYESETGSDTEVSGRSISDAKSACLAAWAGSAWNLKSHWA